MTKDDLITIRLAVPEDNNFILATWLRGLFYGDSWFSHVPKSIFMDHYHKVIDFILQSPNTIIAVACLKEDQDVILGYSVINSSNNSLHWVFVKKAWRGIGISKKIVPNTVNTVTHLTKVGLSIITKKNIQFNPFVL